MTFRKLAAASAGKLIRAYFQENTPEPRPEEEPGTGACLDSGGRLTSYYTGRNSRGTWRPDLPALVAEAMGVDSHLPPQDADLERLFEAKRADTGEKWTQHERKISAYDLTVAPHKSVTLAAEFAESPAEAAMIWNAIDRANDATMRYVARELGWARKGHGGDEGAEAGAVAWVSFRHNAARPTLQVMDGETGVTYLADVPIPGDPHAHIHNALFNLVVTDEGRIGSLDTKRLNDRVHEFGAYFQARLADELRRLGIAVGYDRREEAVVVEAVPHKAVDAFSKGRRQTLNFAKSFAKRQGLDWETLSAERKFGILAVSGLAARKKKYDGKNEREIWREEAETIGWEHKTVLAGATASVLTDTERFDRAYEHVARHLAVEFETAAVLPHDKLRTLAARSLIGTGIAGGIRDVDRVVELVEHRGFKFRGEHAALLVGMSDEKLKITNTAQVRIERTLADKARVEALDRSGALSPAALKVAIDASGIDFEGKEAEHGAAQKAAIYALGTGGGLSVLTGPAGSGKTTLLKPLVAAYQADTAFSPEGRDVIGLSTGWKQADALQGADIERTIAIDPFLYSAENGLIDLSRNTVLVIDEVSQVGPRSFLKLLELQAEHGFIIKGMGDQEQCQAIAAGDTIEILRRVLPKDALPELLTTVRQETARGRHIANLFRQGLAKEALDLKREDGTARLIGGDQDQVIERIADLYMERRDVLRAANSKRGVTISALTNADAADISRVVRARLKARGEIGDDERVYAAISRTGETYDMPLATGDKVRLYSKTSAVIDGRHGFIGSNGDVVEIAGWTAGGVVMRDQTGREGAVQWAKLTDRVSGRMLLGFGHALTVDSAQGITTGEHINALPRGTAGATGFKTYTAESRHVTQVYTMISEAALFEAVKHRRALGDQAPVTTEDLWTRAGEDMSEKRYKPLGMDLMDGARARHEATVDGFMEAAHRIHVQRDEGRQHGLETRARLREDGVRKTLATQLGALDEALVRNGRAVTQLDQEVEAFLRSLRAQTAEIARRGVEQVKARQARDEEAARPSFAPSPF